MEYVDEIREEFAGYGYPVPNRTAWNWVVKLLSNFDEEVAMGTPYLGK
jgi:hypothetical protein